MTDEDQKPDIKFPVEAERVSADTDPSTIEKIRTPEDVFEVRSPEIEHQRWGFNLGNKGIWIDGWSELLEGMAGKVDEVSFDVYQQLASKRLPNVTVKMVSGKSGILSLGRRQYIVMTTSPGATTAVYITRRGQDLYASWKTFVRGVLNVPLLMMLFFFSIIPNLCVSTLVLGVSRTSDAAFDSFGTDAIAFTDVIVPAVFGTFTVFFSLLGLLVAAGFWFQGSSFYYVLIEPTVFGVEDITIMSHAADKAIRNALKKAGVSDALIRRKTDFKGNRRGSIV